VLRITLLPTLATLLEHCSQVTSATGTSRLLAPLPSLLALCSSFLACIDSPPGELVESVFAPLVYLRTSRAPPSMVPGALRMVLEVSA
jgi:hypothetical protein